MSKIEPTIPGGWKLGARCMFSHPGIPGPLDRRRVGRIKAYDAKKNVITISYRGKVFKLPHTLEFDGISGVPHKHPITGKVLATEKDLSFDMRRSATRRDVGEVKLMAPSRHLLAKDTSNEVKLPPIYTVQRITRQEKLYGDIHFSTGANETLCGTVITDRWFILTNNRMGQATCPECKKREAGERKPAAPATIGIAMKRKRPTAPGSYLLETPTCHHPGFVKIVRDKRTRKLMLDSVILGFYNLSAVDRNSLWSDPLNITTQT